MISWLGARFTERGLYNKAPTTTTIALIQELFDEEWQSTLKQYVKSGSGVRPACKRAGQNPGASTKGQLLRDMPIVSIKFTQAYLKGIHIHHNFINRGYCIKWATRGPDPNAGLGQANSVYYRGITSTDCPGYACVPTRRATSFISKLAEASARSRVWSLLLLFTTISAGSTVCRHTNSAALSAMGGLSSNVYARGRSAWWGFA